MEFALPRVYFVPDLGKNQNHLALRTTILDHANPTSELTF
jgi:hypothetical protein